MDQMVKGLYEASVEGSVTSLMDLLTKDPLILDRCTVVTTYEETPLHIAAMLGHLDFCSELVSRNPQLPKEVDSRRSTALHLAPRKGHAEIARVLASACPEMCLLNDGDGMNPIHIAAMKGRLDVLEELVRVHPGAVGARVRTCQGGTVLHLCVEYHQIEALKFLVQVQNGGELVNGKDDNGNSILHLAVGDKQVEIVEYLVSETSIEVDSLNSNGLTASNILALQIKRNSKYMDIAHILQQSPGQRLPQMSFLSQNAINSASSSISGGNLSEINPKNGKEQYVWFEKQRNSLMVVASLIATMAFQAGVNPPVAFLKGNSSIEIAGDFSFFYKIFLISNTIGLLSSLSIILLLISGLPLRRKVFTWSWMVIMWISIAATTSSYTISLVATNWTSRDLGFLVFISIWFDLIALLFLVHTCRFITHRIQDWPFKRRMCMWIFMIVVSITTVSVMWDQGGRADLINPYSDLFFSRIVTVWVVLAGFLIVLYAVQLVFYFVKILRSWFQVFNSLLLSSDHNRVNVV